MMFVLQSIHGRTGESLFGYYIRSYSHLIPSNVEIWKFDQCLGTGVCMHARRDEYSGRDI